LRRYRWQAIENYLRSFNYDEKSIFLIDNMRTYYLVICFFKKNNITYRDEILNEYHIFDDLYRQYLQNPSDENFLAVLSSARCKEKTKFFDIEQHFAFPRTSFERFPLSKTDIVLPEEYTILLRKYQDNIDLHSDIVVHKINFDQVC